MNFFCYSVSEDILHPSVFQVLNVLNDATNLDKRMIDTHKCFGVLQVEDKFSVSLLSNLQQFYYLK